MSNFKLVFSDHWCRGAIGKDRMTEMRPHIIPITDTAKKFVESDYRRKTKYCIFGPLYTGHGFVNVEGKWFFGFRLKMEENTEGTLKEALSYVEKEFQEWFSDQHNGYFQHA